MAQVLNSGLTVPSILVTGEMDAQKAEVFSSTSMVISLKENSSMIKLTAMVSMFTRMARDTKVLGKMICKTAWAKSNLKTVLSIRESSIKERSTVKVSIIGKMELFTMEIG